MTAPVRVVIADDHLLVRRGTREILDKDSRIEVVGEASSGAEAVEQAFDLTPDVVLMDVGMPEVSGIEATRRILEGSSEIRILLLTVHDEDEYVLEGIRGGASGYLLKDVDGDELVRAVLEVAAGGAVLHPGLATGVVRTLRGGGPSAAKALLTPRQSEVLALMARGLSNRRIGDEIGASVRTVEVHVSNILRRLAVRSRTQAVVEGIRRNLIEPPDSR